MIWIGSDFDGRDALNIRIRFTDQPPDFNPENNVYTRALQRIGAVEFCDHPDFVFYGAFGTQFLSYPDSVRIFLANEPVLPNFNDCDYAIGAMKLSFGERYFRQPPLLGFGEIDYEPMLRPDRRQIPENAVSRRFCNFVYANGNCGSGAVLRVQFCRRLSAYRRVDCPGTVLNNMSGAVHPRYEDKRARSRGLVGTEWAADKLAFLRNYKFTIAFENTSLPGFTTEKLLHPLMACSIPIYWGNPDVTEYFNPKAFINCHDYENDWDAVAARVRELDRDPEQYLEMLRRPPLQVNFPVEWEEELACFLSGIVRRGRCPFDKNPIGFATMGAQDLGGLCRSGKAGLCKILQNTADGLKGWLDYKIHHL